MSSASKGLGRARNRGNLVWADLDDREREARKVVVRLVAAGKEPDARALAEALGCSRAASGRLLDALVAKGFVVRDGRDGGIVAAYPLSVRPTRHRVTLANGQRVHALCAMDALGVSPLFQTPAEIESSCPHCQQAVRLEVQEGRVRAMDPSTAAIWYSMADLLERRVEGLNLSAEH